MPKKYWIFIPFNKDSSGDFAIGKVRNESFRQVVPLKTVKNSEKDEKKEIDFVFLDSEGEKLANAKDEDSIYVFGHGEVGYSHVRSGKPNGSEISAKLVAKGLKDQGLKENFRGKIKFYICHSAESKDGDLKHTFAGACAGFLRKSAVDCGIKSIKLASYWGYKGSVDGFYSMNDNTANGNVVPSDFFPSKDMHRWVDAIVKIEGGEDPKQVVRAREHRIDMTGIF